MWKYRIGTVVREKDGSYNGIFTGDSARPMYGHVIGFDTNGFEAILLIRWEDGGERARHPSNVLTEEEDVK